MGKVIAEHRNPVIDADRIEIDFSAIGSYLRCARAYEFRYVKNVKEIPGVALLEGSSYHHAVEKNNLHKIAKDTDLPHKRMTEHFMEDFQFRTKREEKIDWQEQNEDKIYKRAKVMFVEYAREIAPDIKPLHAEEKVEKTVILDGTKITLYGTVDLDTPDVIYDYKTTGKPKSQSEVDNTIQLSLYALMKKKREVGIIQFVKAANPYVGVIKSSRTGKDIMWALHVAKSVVEAVRAKQFPPTDPTSWKCSQKWCGYWKLCRGKDSV